GWRGTLTGILEATLDAMEAIGARREAIRAAIGPCISQRNYEVGPEFLDTHEAEDDESLRFFAGGRGDRMQFDLPGYALSRLRAAGVEAVWTGHCTYGDAARFYSYRRATHAGEPDYGRLLSAIALEG
ncbi:MAG: laccase domain-containing protein, partial [Pseudomonadota bacterium]